MQALSARLIVRVLVSVALLAALLHYVDMEDAWRRLRQVSPWPVAAATLLLMAGQGLSAVRWSWLARGLGLSVRLARKIELYFLGMFLSLFLPSTVGGDVARGFLLARGREGAGWAAAASVLLERVNGVGGVSILASVCLPFVDAPASLKGAWFAGVSVYWLGVFTYPFWHRRLPGMLRRWGELPLASSAFRRAWWKGMVISLTFQIIVVQCHVWLGQAAGLEMAWPAYAVMVCVVGLVSALPVSFNGFGIREAGYVGFVSWLGGDAGSAAVMSALWVLALALAALPVAWILWRMGGRAALSGD